jgi:hypothetical protein
MEDNSLVAKQHDHKHTGKARLIGKLFGKDKKITTEEDVSAFLHGPSDKLQMATPSPTSQQPPLVRLDTTRARRWPTASEINNTRNTRGRSASPKRSRKGLIVRFTDEQPEIIGEGGDEAEAPTSQISSRKRSKSHPPSGDRSDIAQSAGDPGLFQPGPIQRTQTGYESIGGRQVGQTPNEGLDISSTGSEYLKTESHDPMSFAARVQAEMRASESKALTQGVSTEPISSTDLTPQMNQIHLNTIKNTQIPPPSGYLPSQLTAEYFQSPGNPQSSGNTQSPDTSQPSGPAGSPPFSRTPTFNLHTAAIVVGDDVLLEFSSRTAHLFTLFRLSAESLRPISSCSLEELVRAALWWFLRGRMNLEATVRDRPSSPEAQRVSYLLRQQAYADLAKSLWISEQVLPQFPEVHQQGTDYSNSHVGDILDSRQAVVANLRKLSMSMKRNNFLPPDADDAPIHQGLDASIWVRYPSFTPEVCSLLSDAGKRSLVSDQKLHPGMKLSDAFPLGDTRDFFNYSRMFVEASLMEEAQPQEFRCPCMVSIIRPQKEKSLTAIVVSQNGIVKLCIQADKDRGPTWEDVVWRPKNNTIDLKLPRGFMLRLQCMQQDFRTLWGIYDYTTKTLATLRQHRDEEVVFEATAKTFQYFDQNPQSQVFPKEPVKNCQVRLFENRLTEAAATGARRLHRGFRMAIVTSPKTKHLNGIDQGISAKSLTQFGFLRGEGGDPALLLKFDDGTLKRTMVLTFNDVHERTQLHTQLTGGALGTEETVFAEIRINEFAVVSSTEAKNPRCLQALEWQSLRVVNKDEEDVQSTKTVLSEHLRVIMDFRTGGITDRVNIGPGELKLRLDVKSTNELKILRQPQQDMTISIAEAQVSKELPQDLVEVLRIIAESETIRTYQFPSLKELHSFQAALTGFAVIYDSMATSFSISRRRMVVPIYKKWDASTTRLQVVQKEKVVQLVAFFENFSHGDCMNLTLKGTDVFESSTRSGKVCLRIVDAKFALPKGKADGEIETDNGFVCLDMPDYPGEHDDITITFETETGKSRSRS